MAGYGRRLNVRILGLDYGTKTVGVAISDDLLITARALEIIRRDEASKIRPTLRRIEEIISEYSVTKIILGLPLNMDMSMSEMASCALSFKEKIEKRTGLPVIMWDERLSSIEAEEVMRLNGIAAKDLKKYVDMVAAKIILESYLREEKNFE